MKNFFRIILFFCILAVGIVYIDYTTNSAMGQARITVTHYAGQEIKNIFYNIKIYIDKLIK